MPQMTYTQAEVDAIARLAYVTGLRDAIISAQGGKLLSEEQATHVEHFLTSRLVLGETIKRVIELGCAASATGAIDGRRLRAWHG